jgi:hypothetical protein
MEGRGFRRPLNGPSTGPPNGLPMIAGRLRELPAIPMPPENVWRRHLSMRILMEKARAEGQQHNL